MPFGVAERLIAWRYLRPRREEGFISIVAGFALHGIALGVGTLIVVLAVMNGFRAELLGRVLGVNGHATIVAGPQGIADFDALAGRLATAPGVVAVMPYVEGQVMAQAGGVAAGALVRGVRSEDLDERNVIGASVVAGSAAALAEPGTALLGSRMASRMGLAVGDRVTILSPKGVATALGSVPRVKTFRVGGVFEVGMYDYDSTFVFIPLADAQAFFQLPGAVSAIEVKVTDPERIASYRGELVGLADGVGRVVDWQQLNSHFFAALQVERNVMFLILTLIILVAAFNIITGITMLVRSKTRDIAILRTMGATRAAVTRIFLLAGATIGVVGTFAGFVLGLAFASNIDTIRRGLERLTGAELWAAEIRFPSQLPAKVEAGDVLSVVAMGLALSFLATFSPVWRAARLDPVEALRNE